jgi:hypothetical protein
MLTAHLVYGANIMPPVLDYASEYSDNGLSSNSSYKYWHVIDDGSLSSKLFLKHSSIVYDWSTSNADGFYLVEKKL